MRKGCCNYLKPRKFIVHVNKEISTVRQLDFSVPQGAFLFISYASVLNQIVINLTLNGSADDQSIRKEFKSSTLRKDETEAIKVMESFMLGVKDWMDSVHLKINESKMEFILGKYNISQIDINGEQIERSDKMRYVEAHLDSTLSMKDHVKTKCKAAMINLLKIKASRKFLSRKACEKIVISIVM